MSKFPAATLVVHGGNVLDGLGNPPRRGDIVVEKDRIVAVTAGGDLPALGHPVTRIDATGMTVMPGLIDAHCHISFDEPNSNDELFFHRREGLAAIIAAANVRKLLAAGVTGFLDADCLYEIGVDLRDAIEAGIVPGPRMSAGGNALLTSVGGTAGRLIPDRGRRGYGTVVNSRDEIVQEVRRQIKIGVDWVKVHVTGLTPRQRGKGEVQVWSFDELKLVVDTAHELGTPVVGHCRGASSTRDAARAGFDMILHATYMDDEALEAVIEKQVPIVPTFTFQANLADYGEQIGASPEIRALFRKEITESAEMLRRAYAAGVPLLCGTESGFSLTPYGDWHYRELEVFVRELGMTPLQAVASATSANAFALRLAGETGALRAGCLADLLVIDGDVARDVTVLGDRTRIRHVILGGKDLDLPEPSPRRDPPGWRATHYGKQILRRAMVAGSQAPASKPHDV
ncbi:MAG: amidohydrolase family protein [Gammaproteobacteria bacterium]|nr:amidohydrolase family protein [Gammaproteobacteria bacterium]